MGGPIEIREPDDPRIADYRALPRADSVLDRGLFVAEGRLVVQRVLADTRYAVRSLLLSPASHAALRPALERLDPAVPVYVCDVGRFLDITGFNIHRGCLAVVERPARAAVRNLLDADFLVVLEGVTNADNVGGVFRNAAAFGAGAVLLSPGCCDPFYRKAIRTSMAATLAVPFATFERWPEDLAILRDRGFALVALTPREPAITLGRFIRVRPERLAVLVGSEGAGLTPAAADAADWRVRIPILPEVDSLNLSVATGIALFTLSRLSRLTNRADLA